MSDWALLDRARAGSETAWRELYTTYYKRYVRWVSFITGSTGAAQDVVQGSFVRLLTADIRHRDGSFHAYLSTIVYHAALKERRGARLLDRGIGDEVAEQADTPLEAAIRDDEGRALLRIITSLPEQQRDVLILRFYGGHSYQEIADITRVPIGTVKSRIFLAVRSCRERGKAKGLEP
jgi:RNA polymerase sigma factor (sigma-70 family)